MGSKYVLLVGDGMADFPIPELGGKTPLEDSFTPNMDRIAKEGTIGLVSTVPKGLPPGSDVANLSLMGYDPQSYYTGRAPIEAASLGVKLEASDTAFRCNLVTLDNGVMNDYSAGHIETSDAHAIIKELGDELDNESIHFFPGVSYRHLTVIKNFPSGLVCTPPHDITDRQVSPYMPQGSGSDLILELMNRARSILANSSVNKKRVASGKKCVTDIWLWGQGHAITLPSLKEKFNLSGSVISAVDLVRGLGVLAGLNVRIVEGATGYLGTNYAGKVKAAHDALQNEDFVYLHIEAPDETSHEGRLDKKIQAIEEFDKHVVGEVLKFRNDFSNLHILVAPDHATPISLKTHSEGPVPYAMLGPKSKGSSASGYCEIAARGSAVISGPELFSRFVQGLL